MTIHYKCSDRNILSGTILGMPKPFSVGDSLELTELRKAVILMIPVYYNERI